MAIQQNFPEIKPSLNLDFANTKALDPRITFTRASEGRCYDGKTVAKAEENLLTYSQEFDNAAWTKIAVTVTANATTAPDGTSTAFLVVPTATTAQHLLNSPNVSIAAGTTITGSIFAKAENYQYIQFAWGIGAVSGNPIANFDVLNGTLGTVGAGVVATITSVGNGWYRCTATVVAATSTTFTVGTNIISSSTSARAENWLTDGTSGIYLWGAQLEQRDTVTAYTPTTTAPITNYIPVLQTAAAGVARFDHNPVTGESLGLLIEEKRTNLLVRSQEFDNAAWLKFFANVSSNAAVAPDGTQTADVLIEDTTANYHYIQSPAFSATSGTTYTQSFFVKAAGRSTLYLQYVGGGTFGTGKVDFNLVAKTATALGAATGSIQEVGNGWFRISLSQAATSTATARAQLALQFDTYTGDGYSGIYIWGAQLEAGAFPTSYIPTVASQVTRSADAASMTGANFSSWYRADEGTLYADVVLGGVTNNGPQVFTVSDGTLNNYMGTAQTLLTGKRAGYVRSSSVDQAVVFLIEATAGGDRFASAMSYATNNINGAVRGLILATDISAIIPNGLTQANIGSSPTFSQPYTGHIRKIAYWPTRISNTALQAITAS